MMRAAIESYMRKRFVRLHGEGEAHQADTYRCQTCGALVTWNKIRTGEVCCQGHVVPATPNWLETIRLLVLPRTI